MVSVIESSKSAENVIVPSVICVVKLVIPSDLVIIDVGDRFGGAVVEKSVPSGFDE